ncbi:MAG: NADH-quinone oxidoreductase subunit B family protein [Candidatus Dormibacteria bacterium]
MSRSVAPLPMVGTGSPDVPESELRRARHELRRRTSRLLGRSLHIRTIDTGSCGACESEIKLLASPHYDLHRLGLFFTPAPRHADCLLVTGPGTLAMDHALLATYEAMPDPKIVVSVGACPLGGVFAPDQYTHGGIKGLLPIDVVIPGCPPSPLALLQGLLVAVDRLEEKLGPDQGREASRP